MSDEIKDGGPAFPEVVYQENKNIEGWPIQAIAVKPGMTLRQYYAGQALMGYRSQCPITCKSGEIALLCLQDADALIKAERERGGGK